MKYILMVVMVIVMVVMMAVVVVVVMAMAIVMIIPITILVGWVWPGFWFCVLNHNDDSSLQTSKSAWNSSSPWKSSADTVHSDWLIPGIPV